MDAYNIDSIRFQSQERVARRVHEASTERLAREIRGETTMARARKRLGTSWSMWLTRPGGARALTRVRLGL